MSALLVPSGSPPVTASAADLLVSIGHDIVRSCVSGLVAYARLCTGHTLPRGRVPPASADTQSHGEVRASVIRTCSVELVVYHSLVARLRQLCGCLAGPPPLVRQSLLCRPCAAVLCCAPLVSCLRQNCSAMRSRCPRRSDRPPHECHVDHFGVTPIDRRWLPA